MTVFEIDYQKNLLDHVVDEAFEQRIISSEDADTIRKRVHSADSPEAVDECWNDLGQEYELFARFSGPGAT